MAEKKRLDVLVFEHGFTESREKAKAVIMAGLVYVDNQKADKPGVDYPVDAKIEYRGASQKYVSRGGLKLEKAMDCFGIDLQGKICMDIGASTGGFTDCMLQNGAARVYAVDVGTSQLAEKLRADSRVVSLEQLDIRKAGESEIPEKVGFISIDVSFISLKLILPEIKRFAVSGAGCCALIKPQFELGKTHIGKSGVVKDPKLHEKVVTDMTAFAGALGFTGIRTIPSKITGGDGNREFLMYFMIP